MPDHDSDTATTRLLPAGLFARQVPKIRGRRGGPARRRLHHRRRRVVSPPYALGGMRACIVVENIVTSADGFAAAASKARVESQRSRSPRQILARVVLAENLTGLL